MLWQARRGGKFQHYGSTYSFRVVRCSERREDLEKKLNIKAFTGICFTGILGCLLAESERQLTVAEGAGVSIGVVVCGYTAAACHATIPAQDGTPPPPPPPPHNLFLSPPFPPLHHLGACTAGKG